VDSRYHVFIEGQASEIMQKIERLYSTVHAHYGAITEHTLRHELVHALCHNWGLQSIVLSKMREDQLEVAKKKREYLQSNNLEQKRKLLSELWDADQRRAVEMSSSNSWVVEGVAEYLSTSPLGGVLPERLYEFQQAVQDKQVLPLEFLNAFKMGSFPGVDTKKAVFYAYAESWAWVQFLMQRYPQAFLAFLEQQAHGSADGVNELDWLIRATGKGLRPLEEEFRTYMSQLPPQEDPRLIPRNAVLDLIRDFQSS